MSCVVETFQATCPSTQITKIFQAVLYLSEDDRLEVIDPIAGGPTGFKVDASSNVFYKDKQIGNICSNKNNMLMFMQNNEEVCPLFPTTHVEAYLKADVELFKYLVGDGTITF